MFQVMSWIAANRASPGGLISPPQMILAHKGFDGLLIELDTAAGLVAAAVIFEDKATENPRDRIREEVWPDFARLEAGERENVLTAEVTSLLRGREGLDVDKAIESIIWKRARHFRISITVGKAHGDEAGRKRLFKDYDLVATGAAKRRRGETFVIAELRAWMAQLADRAIGALEAFKVVADV
jgi:hypothetical protein